MSHSITVVGPPGSGKSHFAMKALKSCGSGIVVLAPGLAEEASYRAFRSNPSYIIKGFDDEGFLPALGPGNLKATGCVEMIRWLSAVLKKVKESKPEERPAVLVTDTFSAISELAINQTMAKHNRDSAPPAMSPDGASYWTYYAQLMKQIATLCRAIRGEGLHWISLCHIAEKEAKEVGMANPENLQTSGAKAYTPAISGGFRDVYAREFDLVLHAGVKKEVEKVKRDGKEVVLKKTIHYLQWKPDPKRPTKSRYELATTGAVLNDWDGLMEKIVAAD